MEDSGESSNHPPQTETSYHGDGSDTTPVYGGTSTDVQDTDYTAMLQSQPGLYGKSYYG